MDRRRSLRCHAVLVLLSPTPKDRHLDRSAQRAVGRPSHFAVAFALPPSSERSEGPREFPPTPIVHPFQPKKAPTPVTYPAEPHHPKTTILSERIQRTRIATLRKSTSPQTSRYLPQILSSSRSCARCVSGAAIGSGPRCITCHCVSAAYTGHCGSPSPFGSPVFAKLVQYFCIAVLV